MAFEISIDGQRKLFKEHLDGAGNDRIIFSGAFGIGKTYFLDKFFNEPNSEYLAIKLAPVNYSISSNKDIFQLIKYDVLFELAAVHGIALEGPEIDWDVVLGVALPGKSEAIIQSFMPLLPLLNKPTEAIPLVLTALTAWLATGKEIVKQRKEASQEKEAIAFGDKIAAKYQLESDYVTEFIDTGLSQVAAEQKKNCKVLIIDDLDRIDPEHIFRLFNIFSSHLDYNKSTRNKFGFDKVIFVCDIQNVRNIYYARYGSATDFTGYIDKFYSRDIYLFDNIQEIKQSVDALINSFNFDIKNKHYFLQYIVKGDRSSGQSMLALVLSELVHSGILTMRRIMASYGMSYKLPAISLGLTDSNSRDVRMWQVPASITLDLLSQIVGGAEVLVSALKKLEKYKRSEEYNRFADRDSDWLLGKLLPIVDYDKHKFQTYVNSQEASYTYDGESGKVVGYNLIEYGDRHEIYYGLIKSFNGERYNRQKLGFWSALRQATEILHQSGSLR
jgi:hypothetical protein